MKKSYKPYRNRFEQKTGEHLAQEGVQFEYETERLSYTVEGQYTPDFILITKRGRKIYIETKGNGLSFDGHVKRKMIAVKKAHPELDIRILFYSDGKCGPKRKDGTFMRQMEWAAKYGFKAAVKDIPKEWLEE